MIENGSTVANNRAAENTVAAGRRNAAGRAAASIVMLISLCNIAALDFVRPRARRLKAEGEDQVNACLINRRSRA